MLVIGSESLWRGGLTLGKGVRRLDCLNPCLLSQKGAIYGLYYTLIMTIEFNVDPKQEQNLIIIQALTSILLQQKNFFNLKKYKVFAEKRFNLIYIEMKCCTL